jgi:hypothetical protein
MRISVVFASIETVALPIPAVGMADVDATFVQQVFNISKRKWKPDIHHHRQPNDFRRCLKIAKGVRFDHCSTLDDKHVTL